MSVCPCVCVSIFVNNNLAHLALCGMRDLLVDGELKTPVLTRLQKAYTLKPCLFLRTVVCDDCNRSSIAVSCSN